MIRAITSQEVLDNSFEEDMKHNRLLVFFVTKKGCGYCTELEQQFPMFKKMQRAQEGKLVFYHFDTSNMFVQQLVFEVDKETGEPRLPCDDGFPSMYIYRNGQKDMEPMSFYPRTPEKLEKQIKLYLETIKS